MTNPQLPPYIERPAPLVAQPPGFVGDAWVYAFGLRANLDAIGRCAAYLNAAAPTGLTYEPALPMAVITFMSAGKLTSAVPYGWLSEHESAIWVPLLATETDNGRRVAKRLLWWMPYVFVDTDTAMATGREIWGFSKQIGIFEMPESPSASNPVWSISTRLYRTLSPDTEGIVGPLITITGDTQTGANSAWTAVAEAAADVLAIIRREFQMPIWPSLSLASNLFETMVHHEMPLVNLKQFRDCADPTRACYQSIVEGPCTVQTWHGGGLLHGSHHVSITEAASHPVVTDLGLAGLEVDAVYAAWCHMDFLAMPGREV